MLTGKLMGAGGVGRPILLPSYIESAVANSTSVTLSSPPQAGDIILVSAHDYATSPTTFWVSIPSGYTRITRASRAWHASYATQVDMGYKIATGLEGTTISGFTKIGGGAIASAVAVYRPNFSVSTVTPKDVTSGITGDFTSTTVDASASVAASISFIAMTGAISESHTNSATMDYEINQKYSNTDIYVAGLAQIPTATDIIMSGLSGGLGFVYTHTYLELT